MPRGLGWNHFAVKLSFLSPQATHGKPGANQDLDSAPRCFGAQEAAEAMGKGTRTWVAASRS